jgi:hypothetical protein
MKGTKETSSSETVKTTIRVKRGLWNAVLHRSIDENRSSQSIVEQALEEYLKKADAKK